MWLAAWSVNGHVGISTDDKNLGQKILGDKWRGKKKIQNGGQRGGLEGTNIDRKNGKGNLEDTNTSQSEVNQGKRENGKARVLKFGGNAFQLWMGSKNNSTRLAHSLLSNSALAARLIHTSSFSFLFFLFFYFAFNPHTRPLLFIYPPYDDVARDRRSLHKMYTNFSYSAKLEYRIIPKDLGQSRHMPNVNTSRSYRQNTW